MEKYSAIKEMYYGNRGGHENFKMGKEEKRIDQNEKQRKYFRQIIVDRICCDVAFLHCDLPAEDQ